MRILYVEDNPLDGDLTWRALAKARPSSQLEVVATYAGARLRLANPAAYDLVLADLHLPDGSGLDLLAEIRTRKLPLAVVIVTGLGDAELVVNVLKAGADDYVVKRSDYLNRLPQLLEDALAHSRAASARQSTPLRVLYAEQHASDAALALRHMASHAPHIQLETVDTAHALLQRLPSTAFDLILLNCDLPGANVLDLLKEVRQVRQLEVPVVLIARQGSEEIALQALRLGAADYVVKNTGYLMRLPAVLENADYRRRLATEQVALRQSAAQVQAQLALLRALYDASRQLAENMAGVAENVARVCVQILGATAAWLGCLEPDGTILKAAQYPMSPDDAHPGAVRWDDFMREQNAASRAIADHGPVVFTNRANGTGACAIFPLINRDMAVGVLLLSSDQPGFFDEGRIEFFQMYADHAAAALENSRLYVEAQSYAAELEQRVVARTTELIQNRDELSAANDALAKAARLKDEFLASMSHELRTPLTGIMGMSEVLAIGVYGPLNDKQTHALHTIDESGRHLLTLINDMLDMAKIEAGKLELLPASVAANDICQASLTMIRELAFAKHQNVSCVITPDNLVMMADARRLKQILVNLLNNAVKFTPAAGRLGLEVAGDAERQVVSFEVWDEGIGIAAEDLGRLFKPFVQLDTHLTREQTGTGLGLSLVLRLAELHGGSVTVKSTPGAGSRFRVTVPWRTSTAESTALPGTPVGLTLPDSATPAQGIVLIVDDNQVAFTILADFLIAHGYAVVRAANGEEAMQQLLAHRPDVILMDVQMPVIDGITATRNIRKLADHKLAAVPIVAVTALAMPGHRERCLAAGMNDYLSKPVDFATLLALIGDFVHPGGV